MLTRSVLVLDSICHFIGPLKQQQASGRGGFCGKSADYCGK
jgi:hypothetical protein